MAKLVHLCLTCQHPENHHERIGGQPPITSCGCCRAAGFDPNPEPTITETFTHPGSVPEPLWEPGSTRNPSSAHRDTLCGCDRCRAVYAREVG
jgi:hypothetical protein